MKSCIKDQYLVINGVSSNNASDFRGQSPNIQYPLNQRNLYKNRRQLITEILSLLEAMNPHKNPTSHGEFDEYKITNLKYIFLSHRKIWLICISQFWHARWGMDSPPIFGSMYIFERNSQIFLASTHVKLLLTPVDPDSIH